MNEQFDILLPLVLAGEASTEQEKAFFELLENNAALENEYREALKVWLAATALSFDADKALQTVKPAQTPVIPLQKRAWKMPALAASVVLLLGLTLYIWQSGGFMTGDTTAPEMLLVQSGNEIKEVQLPDGTTVWLNRHAQMEYPKQFAGNERRVKLQGEAYFDVARDESKRFITETPLSETEVLGTEYNLRPANGHGYELMVTEGKVSFHGTGKPEANLILTAGHSAILREGGTAPQPLETDINATAWKTREMHFNAAPLDYIFRIMESVYGTQYRLPSPLPDVKFRGTFRSLPESEVRSILSESLGIHFTDSAGVTVINRTRP